MLSGYNKTDGGNYESRKD